MFGTKLGIGIVGVTPTKVVNLDIYIVDQLAGRIVTEPAPRGRFDGTFSRRLYSGKRP